MRIVLFVALTILSFLGKSQANLGEPIYSVEEVVAKDVHGELSKFPIIHSDSNPEAAYKINVFLHYQVLGIMFGNEEGSIFSKVHPKEGEISGQTEFDYSINANDHSFLSITITYLGTGAYSEYFNEEFNFFASTGTHIDLFDLFTNDGMSTVGGLVNRACLDSLDKALQQIDTEGEYASEQKQLYKDCKSRFRNSDQLDLSNFSISDTGITFSKDRCSNHAMAAIDDLWDFNIDLSFNDLRLHLTKNALSAVDKGIIDLCLISNISNKVLVGSIDGQHTITMIFNEYSRDGGTHSIWGIYWDERIERRIGLTGKAELLNLSIAKIELEEIVKAQKTANISGTYSCGEYIAHWTEVGELKGVQFIAKL